jgi:hypothetical protein
LVVSRCLECCNPAAEWCPNWRANLFWLGWRWIPTPMYQGQNKVGQITAYFLCLKKL